MGFPKPQFGVNIKLRNGLKLFGGHLSAPTVETFVAALNHARTTDDVIVWDRLQAASAGIPPLTQRARCELLLRGVNGDALSSKQWAQLMGTPWSIGTDVEATGVFEDALLPLKAALQRVVDDAETAITAFGKNVAGLLNSNIVVVPELTAVRRRWQVTEHVIARSPGEALVYALSLFADPTKAFGRELDRCGLDACGRFAFVPPPSTRGNPANYYCSDDHRLEDERAQSRERAAAKRAGMSIAAWRKRRK